MCWLWFFLHYTGGDAPRQIATGMEHSVILTIDGKVIPGPPFTNMV